MSARQPIDPAWWDTEHIAGVPMRHALAERDIKSVFQFLHRRGWSWGAIAQATDIGEQRVREIANGKRRVENYDVYVRVAVGLNIPREYLGVGLSLATNGTALTGKLVAAATAPPAELTATLRHALDIATPTPVAEHDQPDCCGPRSAPRALVAAYQWQDYVDLLTIRNFERIIAARIPAPHHARIDIFAPTVVVWAYEGPPQPALRALLNLVAPDHPQAPTSAYPAPPTLHIPRAEQRPMTIHLPPAHCVGNRATRLTTAMTEHA